MNVELCRNKARNKFLDGIVLGNAFALNRIVIIGDGHVAWIADDIDDALVAWVERLVTLENAWAIESAQNPIRKEIDFGDARFDIRERNGVVLINKVSDQEAGPGVT